MRAKLPEQRRVRRARRRPSIHYEVYGDGPQTMVFLPPWSIVHSRVYKAQMPYFSERFRCIAYDALRQRQVRPAGRRGRLFAGQLRRRRACRHGCDRGRRGHPGRPVVRRPARLLLAAYHPERVKAAILAGVAAVVGPSYRLHDAAALPDASARRFEGWDKYNRAYWLANYPDFAEHFIRNIFSEPHSTKQIEDGIAWANETTGPVLVKTVEARAHLPPFDVSEAMYRQIRCPVLVDPRRRRSDPALCARGKLVAELTGGELVTIAGGGHNPLGRYPAKCNAADQRLPRSQARHRRAEAGMPRRARKAEARALSLLAHRPRPRPARHRHRAELRKLHPDLRGRLAGAGPGDAPADGQRRDASIR